MPFVSVKMYKGRPVEKKRELAQAITKAFVDIAACKPEWVTVVFEDYDRENWAIGGTLQSEQK